MRKGMCVHYNGILNPICRAGIPYLTFGPAPFKDWPCGHDVGRCDKKRLPTDEEIAIHEAEWEKTAKQVLSLMADISPGKSGTAVCPKCGSTIDWSRSPRNSHLHVKCRTPNCIVVMQ